MLSRMTKAITFRRFVLALGLLALGGLPVLDLAAQAPAGGGRQKVAFIALGADGQPLADLKQAQVELKIDGKVRPVQALEVVKMAGASATAAAPKALFDNPVPPPFGENVATPGRNIMITVDEESMRPGADRPLKVALEQFAGTLGATDRVGLATMPRGTVRVDPTTNRTALKDAIARIGGRLPPSGDTDTCHTRDVLDFVSSLFPSVASDGPTAVVLFSSALLAAGSSGSCGLTSTEFQKVATASSEARAIVYLVMPETSASAGTIAGLQNLAGILNTQVLNLGNPDPPMTKVLRETSMYYLAEIDLDAAERDGKSHRVEVKVTGATVRGQSSLTLAKAGATAPKASARDLVKDGKTYTDLPIRVVGYVSRALEKEKVKVLGMVSPVDPSVKFSSVSIAFTDPSGKTQVFNVPAESLTRSTVVGVIEALPGQWRIRAAAVDAETGRAGSADYQLDAALTPAGPMTMSGLTLGVMPAGGSFMPQIAYTNEAEVVAFYELYGTTQSAINPAFELAETPDGPAIKTAQPDLKGTTDRDRFGVYGAFDIKDLKPGDYVVRATFQVQDGPVGKVFRTLRKLK